MIITKLEMTRFGQFENFVESLSGGLNTFEKDNEGGKSTRADFIRFMFYGLPYKRGKNNPLSEDLLTKYQPWDSENGIAGAMEFLDETGAKWRVERTQNAKGKGRVSLFAADGSAVEETQIGERFLGLDADTFAGVFYIGDGVTSFARTEQMELAMRNLVTAGNEQVGYDSIMDNLLKERARFVSPQGGGGKLLRAKKQLAALENETAERMRNVRQREQALAQKTGLASAEELKKAIEQIGVLESRHEKAARYAQYISLIGLKKQRDTLKAALSGDNKQEAAVLDALAVGFEETERLTILLGEAKREAAGLAAAEPLTEREQEILALAAEPPRRKSLLPTWLCLAGAVVVGGLAYFTLPSLLALSAALVMAGAVFGIAARKVPQALSALGFSSAEELTQAATAAEQKQRDYEFALREQEKGAARIAERETALQAAVQKAQPLRQQTGIFSRAELQVAERAEASAEAQRERIADLERSIAEIGEMEEPEYAEAPAESLAVLRLRRQALEAEQQERFALEKEQAAARAAIEAEQAALQQSVEERGALEQAILQMEESLEIVELALTEMEAAQARLRENYAPRIGAKTGAFLSLLTQGKYSEVMLDESLSVRVKAEGSMRALGYFSAGTRVAILTALRLALIEILEGEKRMPLILDDPFLRMDGRRYSILREFLKKEGEKRQILFYSCREI